MRSKWSDVFPYPRHLALRLRLDGLESRTILSQAADARAYAIDHRVLREIARARKEAIVERIQSRDGSGTASGATKSHDVSGEFETRNRSLQDYSNCR